MMATKDSIDYPAGDLEAREPLLVSCGPHGERIASVVCRHLLRGQPAPAGFIENSSDPNDLQAWCHACEEMFMAEGDMTETFKAFNDMTLVCVDCYAQAKALHGISTS